MLTRDPRPLVIALVACVAIGVTVTGCSSNGGSSDGTTTTSADSPPIGDVVEIPQADVDAAGDYVIGTDVPLGQTADAGGLLITVESIAAGDVAPEPDDGATTTIDVVATVENSTDVDLSGPDVYVVCTDDGRFSTALESSEIGFLETLAPGETLSGTYVVGVPDACGGPLLQARVLPTEVGGDHIAQWTVPTDAVS